MDDILRISSYLSKVRRIARESTGSQIAEVALIFPILFTVFFAIFWFGRAFNIYATLNQAAREGARAGVVQSCGTCTTPGPNIRLSPDQIADAVKQSLQASKIDPGQIQPLTHVFVSCTNQASTCQTPTAAGEPLICVYYDVQLDNPPANYPPAACGVSVSFSYPYTFSLPFTSLNQQLVQIPTNVQMRGEY